MPQNLLQFVHVSDTHLSYDPEYNYRYDYPSQRGAEALVEQLNKLPFQPDFVLHTGDVVYDPDPDPRTYQIAREMMGRIPYPMYYLAGNHDDGEALQRVLLGQSEVLKPFYYSFEASGVQVVCLDSNGPVKPPRGFISKEQLNWLDQICRAQDERPLIVAVHHNPIATGVPWLDDYMGLGNGEDLHQILMPARERLRGVFHGRVHQNVEVIRDGILYSSVLSSWCQFHAWPGQIDTIHDAGAEPGFNVVTITQDRTFIRRCRFRVS